MITATESAIQHIQSILQKYPKNAVFRLSIKQTGCSGYMYVPEVVTEKNVQDIAVQLKDFTLYVDSQWTDILKDVKMDYVKKNLGVSQLTFENPNAEGLCGCGESFTLKS